MKTKRSTLLWVLAALSAQLAVSQAFDSVALAGGDKTSRAQILERENQALKARLEALEKENQALRSESAPQRAEPAPKEEAPAALDVNKLEPNRPDMDFFNLGVKRDYLKTERWRIAEQIQQFIPPLYEPVLPFHGYTLPPGAMRMKISTSFFDNDHDFGTDHFYSLFFDNVSVRNLFVSYDFFYGLELPTELGKDLVANLNVPYKRISITGTGHPFRINPFVMTMNGNSQGVGDVSLTIKKKWLDQGSWPLWLTRSEGSFPFNLATFTGIITPTGEHHESFNSAQILTVGGKQMPPPPINLFGADDAGKETYLPNGAQPGTGAWGFRIGAAATRQFERSAFHAGLMANLYTKTSDGITPGNEIMFGTSYVFPPLRSDLLSIDLSIFGRHKSDEEYPGKIMHPERDPRTGGPIMNADGSLKMFLTDRPNFKHGTVVFASPSLILVPTPQSRIIFSPALRILEPTQGPSPLFTFTTSAEITF